VTTGHPVKITDTCLRDAHQSLLATRLSTAHMLPIAEKYGRPPGPVSAELRRLVLGDQGPIHSRPAGALEPGYEPAKAEIGDLAQSEEDVISFERICAGVMVK